MPAQRQSWCPPVAAKGTEDEFPTNDPIWNPDIDDVALDDDYYELIGGDDRGIDTEVDPEAEVLSMDDMERMLRDPQLQSLFAGQWAKGAADGPAEADPPLTSPQACSLQSPSSLPPYRQTLPSLLPRPPRWLTYCPAGPRAPSGHPVGGSEGRGAPTGAAHAHLSPLWVPHSSLRRGLLAARSVS